MIEKCSCCQKSKEPVEMGLRSENDCKKRKRITKIYCMKCKSSIDSQIAKLGRKTIQAMLKSTHLSDLWTVRQIYIKEKASIMSFKQVRKNGKAITKI